MSEGQIRMALACRLIRDGIPGDVAFAFAIDAIDARGFPPSWEGKVNVSDEFKRTLKKCIDEAFEEMRRLKR